MLTKRKGRESRDEKKKLIEVGLIAAEFSMCLCVVVVVPVKKLITSERET